MADETVETQDGTEELDAKNPALRGYSRTAFKVKYVATKVLKFAVLGAIAIGAIAAGIGLFTTGSLLGSLGSAATSSTGIIIGALAAAFNWIAPDTARQLLGYVTEKAGPFFAGITSSVLSNGLMIGGIAGAAIGLVMAIHDSDEAADGEEARLNYKYKMAQARERQTLTLKEQALTQAQESQKLEEMLTRGPLPQTALPLMPRQPEGRTA